MTSDSKPKVSWPKASWKIVSPEDLKPMRSLYRKARFLDAYELAQKIGPLQTWRGSDARTFAADLAGALAGYRLSDWLEITAYRDTPDAEEAQLSYAGWLNARRGPLACWWFLDRHPIRPDHTSNFKFRWYSFRATVTRQFRDFELSKKYSDAAKEFCDRPELIPLAECYRLRKMDRPEEALQAARQAHAINPTQCSALREIAEILLEQNSDQECLAFFDEAFQNTQDNYLLSLKIRLLVEKELFSDALSGLDLYEKWTPLIEKRGLSWLNIRRSDACYHLGRFDESIEWAKKVDSDFYKQFVERLQAEKRRIRVRLPVGYIRQDYFTCGPATLVALARFWEVPADHDKVVENICYGGTYDYQERKWAEDMGFFVREFKVTWESSRQLLDLGIPFALATSEPGSAHLQAVIGYDAIWQTLLIRDPGRRDLAEFDWKDTEKSYRAVGPRGMVFVPMEKKALLQNLDLPEAALYDSNYQISLALNHHHRDEAFSFYSELEKKFPDERMTLVGRRTIADYDNNAPDQISCDQKLLKLFPNDERLNLSLFYGLRQVVPLNERLSFLRSIIHKKNCNPIFWKEFAIELMIDSREQESALKYLKMAHASMPWHAHTASTMADILWNRGEISAATDIYRFVACAEDKKEGPSRSFFIASRQTRRTDEAIDFLRNRFALYGSKSPDPIRTLFYALEKLDRITEAFTELEKALALRPEDGELLCYAADHFRNYGKKEDARKLLEKAENKCPRIRWLRISGRLAQEDGELLQSLKYWQEVASLEPLDENAHSEIADLLAKTQSRKAAIAYLHEIYEKFPFNLEMNKLLLSWVKSEDEEEAIVLCRKMVTDHPSSDSATRDLATALSRIPKYLDESLKYAQLVRDLNPRSSDGCVILGNILQKLARLDEARESFREAIRLNVDNNTAISKLIDLSGTLEEKRKELLFIHNELVKQVVFGEGLSEFYEQAKRALPPDEVLRYLNEAKEARPDLWQAWYSLTHQFSHMRRQDEALANAHETTKRFPLTPGSWRTLGDMYSRQDEWAKAAEALEKAVALSPEWVSAITELSVAYRRNDEWDKALATLEKGLRQIPTSYVIHGFMAELLHLQGKRDECLSHLRQAIELNSRYRWAWDQLCDWGSKEEYLKTARELTRKRPGEAHTWLILAQNLNSFTDLEEKLQALDRSIALAPQDSDAYDYKAEALAENSRFEEALATCHPNAWGGLIPLPLRGRAAWIEQERGNRKKAITLMEQVVADDSSYNWGWKQLSDWYLEENRVPEGVRAAENLVRLSPNNAVSYGYRADAKIKQGDHWGALEDLRRSHILDPDYNYATHTLFDLLVDDEERDEAENLLEEFSRFGGKENILTAEIVLAIDQNHIPQALDKFKEIGQLPEVKASHIKRIQECFQKNDLRGEFDLALEDIIWSRKASGPLLGAWVRRKAARQQWNMDTALDSYLQSDREAARTGIDAYLDVMGNNGLFTPYAKKICEQHAPWIRETTYSWGLIGFAMRQTGMYQSCTEWLSDWRERQGLKRWMLINLSESLRNLGNENESDEVCRRILEIEPDHPYAHVTLAFDLARKGDYSTAETHLQKMDESNSNDSNKFYQLITNKIIALSKIPQPERSTFFQEAKNLIERQKISLKKPNWEIQRTYYLGLATLADLSNSQRAILYRIQGGRFFQSLFRTFDRLPG